MFLDEVQVRLTVLYAMRCSKTTVSEDMFQEMIVHQDIIDYFTMMDCVYDLEKMGYVKVLTVDGEKRFDITKKGLNSITMFKDKVPLSIRDKIYDKAYEIGQRIARGHEFNTDVVPLDDKRFMAKCGLYEWGTPLMEVSVFAGSKKSAQEITKKFEVNAAKMYRFILENLVE